MVCAETQVFSLAYQASKSVRKINLISAKRLDSNQEETNGWTGSLLKWLNVVITVSSSSSSRFFSVSSAQTNGSCHSGFVIVTQHFCLDFRMLTVTWQPLKKVAQARFQISPGSS